MADYTQDIGFEGGISNMVPATFVSRVVDTDAIAFGLPVKQGATAKSCAAGIAAGDFIGITTGEFGIGQFEKDTEARIMTIGVIWVKAAVKLAAGNTVSYSSSGWGKAATAGNTVLDEARYDSGAELGELVQIRLWGTNTTAGA
jgi:hypothetical protein